MTQLETTEYPTYEGVAFKPVELRALVYVTVYVPVDFEPQYGHDLEATLRHDLDDAIEHRFPRLTDFEDGDGPLVTKHVSVTIDHYRDARLDQMDTTERLTQLVEGTAAETF